MTSWPRRRLRSTLSWASKQVPFSPPVGAFPAGGFFLRHGGRFAARAPGSGRSAPTFQPHARLSLPQSSSRRNAPRGGSAAAGRVRREGRAERPRLPAPHPQACRPARKRFPEGNRIQLVKKVLTSWWTGEQAPPPLPPSPVSAKNRRFFGRGACKETLFSLENGIFRRKNRPVPTLYICTAFLMEKRQQVEPGTARSKGLRPSRALLGFLTV